jgi:hypothetical protein
MSGSIVTADRYRTLAAKFDALARTEQSIALKREFFGLGASYRRLAELSDRNEFLDVSYESPAPNQQMQQIQLRLPSNKL